MIQRQPELEAATTEIMASLCTALGWKTAVTWIREDEVLRSWTFWRAPGVSVPNFERASRTATFKRGESLPGRCWETKRPLWIADATVEPDFRRRHEAERDHLHAGVWLPILVDDEVAGVMELLTDEVLPRDETLLRAFNIVGTQVSLIVARERAQDGIRRSAALLAAERRVLASVAEGRPLPQTLDELARTIEALSPGMLASVLLLDEASERLHVGAAPNLPAEFSRSIEGVKIGPNAGSCGSATWRNEVVITPDIAVDPAWAPWRDVALRNGLRACWSMPICSSASKVIGSFALYYNEPRSPSALDLDLIEGAAHVARIAIERHRIDARTAALIEDLQRAVRFSEMFVGVLGHDLRNPLGAMITAARLLQEEPEPARIDRLSQTILRSGNRMTRMIDQLLDFTRIRLGHGVPIDRRSSDLVEICHAAIEELQVGAPALACRIESSGDTGGMWDHDRLTQLVSNLVGNAVRHGTAGAPVLVRIDGTDADTVALEVINSGEVPRELLPLLFDPLTMKATGKGPHRTRGLGLGLFISQHVARAHGGDINVASSAGRTTVTVRLPRARELLAQASSVTFEASLRNREKTVLIVEDEPDIRELLVEVLAGHGYRVLAEGTVANAIARLRGEPRPSLVILDLALDEEDGATVHNAMMADAELAKIPVIVSTGDPSRAPSGVLMIKKPVDVDVLLDTMRRLF